MERSFTARLAGARRAVFSFNLALVAALVVVSAGSAQAQGIGGRLRQKIKDKVDGVTDSLADAAVDKSTGAVMCAATKPDCIKKAHDAGKNVEVVDSKGKKVSPADSAKAMAKAGITDDGATATASASAGAAPQGTDDVVLVNYDFVPGDRVIFAEDFSKDDIGDFPKRVELEKGNLDVVQWHGQKALRSTSYSKIHIPLPEAIPSRFTFEFDFLGVDNANADLYFVNSDEVEDPTYLTFTRIEGGLYGGKIESRMQLPDNALRPNLVHVAIMADGKYAKVYLNGVRVSNVPNASLGRGKALYFILGGDADAPNYLTNLRLAAGGKPLLYDSLMADGRVATHGILFDTGSDHIRGESKPTLDQIGQMLQSHADLKLTIEGHTDDVGNEASNQTLSEKRAAAVRQYLIANYHVDGARLTSKGLGSTKPAVPNTTPEGRQQNRRVELVKN